LCKIFEEKEKKLNIEILKLQEESRDFIENSKEKDDIFQKEKEAIMKINEGLQQGIEKMNGEREVLLNRLRDIGERMEAMEKMMKEREKQMEVEGFLKNNGYF